MAALTLSKAEREAFLAGVHVAVFAVADGARGPIAVPVWYAYDPGGDILINTGKSSPKAVLAAAAGRATLCVQSEAPPYGYVSVEGRAVLEPADYDGQLVPIARRYLGAAAEMYLAGSSKETSEADNVLIRLTPERWRTADFSKQYQM